MKIKPIEQVRVGSYITFKREEPVDPSDVYVRGRYLYPEHCFFANKLNRPQSWVCLYRGDQVATNFKIALH